MVAVDVEELRGLLDECKFSEALIGCLGWDNPPAGNPPVRHEEDGVVARQVASKHGVGVWVIDSIPSTPAQKRIGRLIAQRTREHLLVFVGDSTHLWQWPEQRPSGSGFRLVDHEHHVGTKNKMLLQRLASTAFSLEEEAALTIVDVIDRVRGSFNAEKVTKRFYNELKTHKEALLKQVKGIKDPGETAWYGSVLLNRLMLVYFLQKKGFLDGDREYLGNRLALVREHLGKDAFYGFFREFLLPLFHEGLGSPGQDFTNSKMQKIIGDVPYVNGGIFLEHKLESVHDINVPDTAFEAIFAFFDKFRWHLDESPSEDANEINPDVLGYVFEQYVNSKEMGAYYTKEDVTGYMTSVTLLPAYLERLALGDGALQPLLSSDPDRYIYDSVRFGTEVKLPETIQCGVEDESERANWFDKAGVEYGLHGESWWEVIDRRHRYEKLKKSILNDELQKVEQIVTKNLDLRTLVIDYLYQLPDIDSVKRSYEILSRISVLDPTCGSGAFLFAALEIFSDLYLALIERAKELVALGASLPKFLIEAEEHPNIKYFILRSTQLNNLYGVDLMAEAGEIARLRMFLKLAAQIDSRELLEPFPDLDLNIKCGNLLIGIANPEDAKRRFEENIIASDFFDNISESAVLLASVHTEFIDAQTAGKDPKIIQDFKILLQRHESELRESTNETLHLMRSDPSSLDEWVTNSQPFHWFIEFPNVFINGGFDVVVGNPPYIRKKNVDYKYYGYETNNSRDIYAPCMERAMSLMRGDGKYSMIVPISFQFSEEYEKVRQYIAGEVSNLWISTFSRNPSALFPPAVGVRSSIVVGSRGGSATVRTTRLYRWWEGMRQHLFDLIEYAELKTANSGTAYSRPGPSLNPLFESLTATRSCVGASTRKSGPALGFKSIALYYLSVYVEEPPSWTLDGTRIPQTAVGELRFEDDEHRDVAMVLLAGRFAAWWWSAVGDDFNVTGWVLEDFPVGLSELNDCWEELLLISKELQIEQQNHPLVTKYAKKEMGNYDMSKCRHITDRSDQLVLKALGHEKFWPALLLADAQFVKPTGERPGTRREWPFPL